MAKTPAVSVIVPIYNVEQYVKFCVDSILAQTFQDFEIILVDDASPDNSYALCQKFYGDNDKVKFIRHEKNQGLGASRNTGIKHAAGKYVYFVDSDDYILPDALEKLYNAAEKNNAQVVHVSGWYELINGSKNLQIKREESSKEGLLENDVKYRLDIYWKPYIIRPNAWLCFCRRDFLEKNGFEFLPILSEDVPFGFALLCTAKRYYVLNEYFYVYRSRDGSIMQTYDSKRFSEAIRSMLTGATYIENILNGLPKFEGYEIWRESLIETFFERRSSIHIAPFYSELKIPDFINETAIKTFLPTFGNLTPFVKYFFNGYHIFRRQAQLLALQSQLLLNENKQLKSRTSIFTREQFALLEIINAVKSADKRIFLIGTPEHGNLGDHAIAMGEERVLKDYFPEHKIIEIRRDYLMGESGELLSELGLGNRIRKDDILFYHGGGNLGNLWVHEEKIRRNIIKKFPDNKIVIFPQSICFTDDADGHKEREISARIYNAHKDLHLMARDENSFNLARKIFPAIHNYLLPDAATVMHGIMDDVDIKREGILFILRGDKEKVRDDTKIQILQATFDKLKIPFAVTDTRSDKKVSIAEREQKVRAVLAQIRKSKLVITDRFHGVVFSFITRTPVLAFKSFDTKISSGIKWFEQFQSVFYAEEQDLNGIGNFIQRALSGEAPFAEMNPAVKFNSRELFRDTLNQIVGTQPVKSIPNLPNVENLLTVDKVIVTGNRISYRYRVQGEWRKYFNVGTEFFIEYSEDVSKTPESIAVIPFLCNVLPIAWVCNACVVVPELDFDFYNHIDEIKQGYINMYPQIKFGGQLTVGKLIERDYETCAETAAFFSGGVDSFDTLIAHAEEHPTLITLRGSDIKLSDTEGWERVSKHTRETATQFGCKNLFITSTFRLFLNEGALSNLVMPLANDGWWHGFHHGIGIISHAAPYVYLHKFKTIYIASSFTKENWAPCASDPTIDNHVNLGKCKTVHDGYEFSRQDKIRRICDYKRATGKPIRLRVCWQSSGGQNCCACEKCYRTICDILAEGENPTDLGFPFYSTALLEQIKLDFQKPSMARQFLARRWASIQARFREKPENLPKELAWLMEVKF